MLQKTFMIMPKPLALYNKVPYLISVFRSQISPIPKDSTGKKHDIICIIFEVVIRDARDFSKLASFCLNAVHVRPH